MIITVSGLPGSGKTTIAKLLAEKLGYKHLSGGDIRGQIAMKHGLTIDELNELGSKESWTDTEVDDEWKRIGEEEDNYVVDSWIAFHFIPKSIKIFLRVNSRVGAERVFLEPRPDEEKKQSVEEVEKVLAKRVEHTNNRYKKYYSTDFLNMNNYDFVIDTSNLTREQVLARVEEFVRKGYK